MIAVVGALLCGLTAGLLALAVRPPQPVPRHEPVKERDSRRLARRRARFRVRSAPQGPLQPGGKWKRPGLLALLRRHS